MSSRIPYSHVGEVALDYLLRFVLMSPILALAVSYHHLFPGKPLTPFFPLLVVMLLTVFLENATFALFFGVIYGVMLLPIRSTDSFLVSLVSRIVSTVADRDNALLILAVVSIFLIQASFELGFAEALAKLIRRSRTIGQRTVQLILYIIGLGIFIDDYLNYSAKTSFIRIYKERDDLHEERLTTTTVALSLVAPSFVLISSWGIYIATLTDISQLRLKIFGNMLPIVQFGFYQIAMMISVLVLSLSRAATRKLSPETTQNEAQAALEKAKLVICDGTALGISMEEPKKLLEQAMHVMSNRQFGEAVQHACHAEEAAIQQLPADRRPAEPADPTKASWLQIFVFAGGVAGLLILVAGVLLLLPALNNDILSSFVLIAPPFIAFELIIFLIVQYLRYREIVRTEIARHSAPKIEGEIVVTGPTKDLRKVKKIIVDYVLGVWDSIQAEGGTRLMSLLIFLILMLTLKDIIVKPPEKMGLGFGLLTGDIVSSKSFDLALSPLLGLTLAATMATAAGSSYFALAILIPAMEAALNSAKADVTLQVLTFSAILGGATFGNTISLFGDVPIMHRNNLRNLYHASEKSISRVFRELRIISLACLTIAFASYWWFIRTANALEAYTITFMAAVAVTFFLTKKLKP